MTTRTHLQNPRLLARIPKGKKKMLIMKNWKNRKNRKKRIKRIKLRKQKSLLRREKTPMKRKRL